MNPAKRPTIVLYTLVAVIVVASAILLGPARELLARRSGGSEPLRIEASGEVVTKTFGLSGYDAIASSGSWEIRVVSAEGPVEVSFPASLEEYLVVEVRGSTLTLGVEPNLQIVGLDRLRAIVPAATIESVETSGVAELILEAVDLDRLALRTSGVSALIARGCAIGTLRIEASGVSDFDFAGARVGEAKIELSGAGEVSVDIDGGTLTGNLSGATNLVYGGNPASVDVEISGASSVKRR
jgi:hypothetical protein